MDHFDQMERLLRQVYGDEKGLQAMVRLRALIEMAPRRPAGRTSPFSQGDMVLITYGDSLHNQGEAPLVTLRRFADRFLRNTVASVHFLPFFPYSSDDGFSVKDFFQIDPALGGWDDVAGIGENFGLMFDFVINHFSAEGDWFAAYLDGRPGFGDFALEADPKADLSAVTRPRALPLLTPFAKTDGTTVHLWTTFSADQIDFNYASLDVLEKMIEVLLFYVDQGVDLLRLDAIAYLWKRIGTPCIHLPETHAMVRLFRKVLDVVAPEAILITETNVPHQENISYFGNDGDEAQMVYNFTLPPLLFHTFVKADARALSAWAATLTLPSERTAFFNFTASHDGIGVRPLEGILRKSEIDDLIRVVEALGGQVSTKDNPDGSQSPYELNTSYVDAILGDRQCDDAQRFLASQAIQYALPGVPATYIHSLLGSRNWHAGVAHTGRARTINREKLDLTQVMAELNDPASFRSRVFFPYLAMIRLWRRQPAFHPKATFEIVDAGPAVFAIRRSGGGQELLALTNVSDRPQTVDLAACRGRGFVADLVSDEPVHGGALTLGAYQFVWLTT